MIRGIDVASYQGNGSWTVVKASGIDFAFVKATQSTNYVNPSFVYNWRGIQNVGMVRGAYHFAGLDDPIAEANHFCDTVQAAGGWVPGDGMVLDLETGRGDLSSWADQFLQRVHVRSGLPGTLYSGAYFFTAHNLTAVPAIRWVAAYGSRPGINYNLWQYTDRATVPGLGTTVVDCSSFDGSIDQLRALFGAATTPPTGGPPPVIPKEQSSMRVIARPDGSGFDALVRGIDNAAWHCWSTKLDGLTTENNWESLGGIVVQTPDGLWQADMSALHVFMVGTDGGLYREIYDNKAGKWGAITKLQGRAGR